MIDSDRIHRAKMIQKTSEHGSTILSDTAEADEYTRFPLKNTFELDLMDTLLSRSRVLLVQSRAVHTYLYGISELMEADGTSGLNPRWTVLPVNTVENVPAFLGMFESYDLDAAVLLEGATMRRPDQQLPEDVSVRDVGEYAEVAGQATVEDLLSEPFYLGLVSRAYADALANAPGIPDRLSDEYFDGETGEGPIVERLDTFFEQNGVTVDGFDREVPAAYFREHREEFTDELDLETKRGFGSLVKAFDDILDSTTRTTQGGRSFVDVLLGR